MYGLRSKLVCFLAQAILLLKLVCLSMPEDTSLLRNLSFFRKLQIRNVF
jgi:hypothetical protein